MRKFFHLTIFIILLCQTSSLQAQASSRWNQDSSYYIYNIINEKLEFEKVSFGKELTKKQIVDSIASYLSYTYFIPKDMNYKGKQKIEINIENITLINLPDRKYSIATVNINDPDKICMATYFQGSAGGHYTFLMLVSNLLQPQLKYPLLDGIIILYNNSELKNMDHIDLEGLMSEREIDLSIRKALKN